MTQILPTYGLTRTVAPTERAAIYEEVAEHLRIDDADAEIDVTRKIDDAIEFIETATGRALLTSTWQVTFDKFPTAREPQRLPLGWLQTVDEIQYTDTAGTVQTVNAATVLTDYQVITDREPGLIAPIYTKIWPVARDELAAVRYTITCGKTAANLPASVKSAINLLTGHLYENREETTDKALRNVPLAAMHRIENLKFDDFLHYDPQ
tara:strand:+ start:8116 stop:8739 length:624 start_codon:yes stop_codon:yes gene_type:complete